MTTTKTKDPHQDPALLAPVPMEHLHAAIDSSSAVAERIKTATAAALEAKEKFAQHEAVTIEAKNIQAGWKKLCDDLAILQTRLVRAEDQLGTAEKNFEKKKAHLNGYIGGDGSNLLFQQVAVEIATVGLAIPVLAEAKKHLEGIIRDHLTKIREFGVLHGLPKEILDQLKAGLTGVAASTAIGSGAVQTS